MAWFSLNALLLINRCCIKLISPTFTLDTLCAAAADRKPFAFARYGDGEWIAMLKLKSSSKRNCDWHQYFPAMGQALADTLACRPSYWVGLQGLAYRLYGDRIDRFIQEHGLQGLRWCDAEVLHKASVQGELGRFAKLCRQAVWVGPQHLAPLVEALNGRKHVVVPTINAWESYSEFSVQAINAVRKSDLVLISCGMPAKVLLRDLLAAHPLLTCIDTGAVWDLFVGVRSRKYMRNRQESVQSLLA